MPKKPSPRKAKGPAKTDAFHTLATADRIYFTGKAAWEFWEIGKRIAPFLPRFDGAVVAKRNEQEDQGLSGHFNRPLKTIEPRELLRVAEKYKITLIDFSSNRLSLAWVDQLAAHPNITRCDYVQALYETGQIYTYVSMRTEREYVLSNLSRYKKLAASFKDKQSQAVVRARMNTILKLDRRYLFPTLSPPGTESFCANCPTAALIPGPKEVYVDVGAHNGDTIRSFLEASQGKYKRIVGIEPCKRDYEAIVRMGGVLPNLTAHQAALGAESGFIDFHVQEAASHGSNAFAEPNTKVRLLTLDEVAPDATLIKIDVEGFEAAVITGAKRTIKKNHPAMAIAAYHYPKDTFELLDTVQDIHRYKNRAARQYSLTLFDFVYLFSDKQSFG